MATRDEILNNIPCLAEAKNRIREKEHKASLKRIIKAYKSINIKKAFKKEVNVVPKYSYKEHSENFVDVKSSDEADRGVSILVDIENNITFTILLYDYTCPPEISEDGTEEFIDVPFVDYDEELLKKLFNITAEECQQVGEYDKILATLSKILSKKVVKEVKKQIENMLSDNITDIICTIQKNVQ